MSNLETHHVAAQPGMNSSGEMERSGWWITTIFVYQIPSPPSILATSTPSSEAVVTRFPIARDDDRICIELGEGLLVC